MLPKILLNSRVSGNKYLRGSVLTGWKGHSKKCFCLVVWGFFVFSFFLGGVFLTAWYKNKTK